MNKMLTKFIEEWKFAGIIAVLLILGGRIKGCAVPQGSSANDRAQEFIAYLNQGDYQKASAMVQHFKDPPSPNNLRVFWNSCLGTGASIKRWTFRGSLVKAEAEEEKSTHRLIYILETKAGAKIPMLVAIEEVSSQWLISNFSCAMKMDTIENFIKDNVKKNN